MMIRHILKYAFAVMLLGSLCASCITDSEDDVQPAKKITVRFTLVTQKAQADGSRAEVSDIHPTEPGTDRENEIDVDGKDYRILAFDPASGYLYEDLTETGTVQKKSGQNGNEFHYTVTFSQPRTVFQLVVLANWNNFKVGDADCYGTFTPLTTKLSDVMAKYYTLPTTQNGDITTQNGDMYIPMVGMQTYAINPNAIPEDNSRDKPYLLADINMLRSVAKIEVIDGLTAEGISIGGVSLTGYNSTGTFWPNISGDNSGWNTENMQVLTPTIPTNPNPEWITTPLTFSFFEQENKHVLYVSECNVSADNNPEIAITISNPNGSTPETAAYSFNLNDYKISSLLRNHIYRFEIKSASTGLNVKYTVCPMDNETSGNITFD